MEKQIYRDCQKNHACYDGGYAIDGCREFIPCSTMEIHCQACGCHRNYHRKVPFIDLEQFPPENGLIRSSFRSLREAKRIARQRYLLPAPSSQADCEPKQRRKSKFSKGQRDAMRAFAESLGWTMMNKGRQADISRFCEVIGISRPTFKTWLNNNKKFYNKTTDSASGASSSSSKTA